MLAKSKLNSIEIISQALIDLDISHEELLEFKRKKINTKGWKKKSENEEYRIMKLSSIISKI